MYVYIDNNERTEHLHSIVTYTHLHFHCVLLCVLSHIILLCYTTWPINIYGASTTLIEWQHFIFIFMSP